jgi:transcription elongation factor GreA-like protein
MAIRDDAKYAEDNMDYKSKKDAMQKNNNMEMAGIPKDLSYEDAVRTFKLSLDREPTSVQEVIDFFKNRKLNKKLPEKPISFA